MPETLQQMIEEARKNVPPITTREAKDAWDKGEVALILDVREPGEWQRGHIPGAVLIPRGVLELQADLSSPSANPNLAQNKDERIVIHCGRATRAILAADTLKRMGYTNVFWMSGGFEEWAANGWPVEIHHR